MLNFVYVFIVLKYCAKKDKIPLDSTIYILNVILKIMY